MKKETWEGWVSKWRSELGPESGLATGGKKFAWKLLSLTFKDSQMEGKLIFFCVTP